MGQTAGQAKQLWRDLKLRHFLLLVHPNKLSWQFAQSAYAVVYSLHQVAHFTAGLHILKPCPSASSQTRPSAQQGYSYPSEESQTNHSSPVQALLLSDGLPVGLVVGLSVVLVEGSGVTGLGDTGADVTGADETGADEGAGVTGDEVANVVVAVAPVLDQTKNNLV